MWFPVCNLDMNKYLEKYQTSSSSQQYNSHNKFKIPNENEIYSTEEYGLNDKINGHTEELNDTYDQSNYLNRPYVYDLFAVCNHKGQNMANGHYTGN